MSGFSFDFEPQLRGPWEMASGFIIETFQRIQAQLAPIFPLIDGIQATVTSTAANALIGLSGYPVTAILTTNSAGTPGFTTTLPGPMSFVAGAVSTPAALIVNTNDYTPASLSSTAVLRISATGAVNVTGLIAATTAQAILVCNIGGFAITFTHADALSVAANRFRCPGAANVVLATLDSRWIWYDPTSAVWQVVT